jgi:hypothetical protein
MAAGPLADLLGPVIPPPLSAAADWARGAAGEELTAQLLAPLSLLGWTVLHDRRIPGSPANIDHLAIAGTDLFVIDTKAWRGQVKLLPDGRFWYGRTPLNDVLTTVLWEATQIGEHLARHLRHPVPTRAVLCLHGARLPADPLVLGPVAVVTGRTIVRFLLAEACSVSLPDHHRLAEVAIKSFSPR